MGEIEAWGLGVERMFSACRAAGLPVPKLRCEPDGCGCSLLLTRLVGEMSRAELMAVLNLKDKKHFRTHYRQAALAAGVLEMTVPDKPQSCHQKYRLTASGRQWITRQHKP